MPPHRLNIGVVGAGNIGTAMAALLSRSEAHVYLGVRGPRLEAVRAKGVCLNDRGTEITAHPSASDTLPHKMDAIFFCVKSQSLPQAILSNRAAIGPDTLVIPMVNGMPFWFFAEDDSLGQIPYLDPTGELDKILLPSQVLGAVLMMTVRMDQNACAQSSNTPTLSLGRVTKGKPPRHLKALLCALNTGGVRTDLSDNIRQKVLVKLLANLCTNPLTALTGVTLKTVGEQDALRSIATRLADDFRDWAGQHGYDLPTNDWLIDLFIDAGDFPTSMLQDAQAGRALELDAICRAPLELARREGGDMALLARLIAEIDNTTPLPVPPSEVPATLRKLDRPLSATSPS